LILIKARRRHSLQFLSMVTRFPPGAQPHKPVTTAKDAVSPGPVAKPVVLEPETCCGCDGDCAERKAKKKD